MLVGNDGDEDAFRARRALHFREPRKVADELKELVIELNRSAS
jgi:hypothetical protein